MELMKDDPKDLAGKTEEELHPGCVKRVLSMRDRVLIFQALNKDVERGGDAKTLSRLVALQEILGSEDVEEYFETIDKEQARRTGAYAKAFEKFVKEGGEDPGPQPKISDEDMIGPSGTYWIKSKLDTHIAEILKKGSFAGVNAEYVLSLFKKYDIKIED